MSRQPRSIDDFSAGDRVKVAHRYSGKHIGTLTQGAVVTVSRVLPKLANDGTKLGGWLYIDGHKPDITDSPEDEDKKGFGMYIFDVLTPDDPEYLPEPTDDEIRALFGIRS